MNLVDARESWHTPDEREQLLARLELLERERARDHAVRVALEALQSWGRPHRVQLVAMVDRGHRELPIQPDFCGRVVPTTRLETIQLCLQSVDGEEGVYLIRPPALA